MFTTVDFVNHHREIDSITTIRINRARIMAGNAVLRFNASPAMHGKFIVTGITGLGLDDLPRDRDITTSRDEIVDRVMRREAVNLDSDAMRQ